MVSAASIRKARPARVRIALRDDAADSVTLPIPAQRSWPAAVFCGIAFLVFAGIGISQAAKLPGQELHSVFDLTGLLFQGFWVLGWSVGVLMLLGLTILLASHGETARLTRDRLIHAPRIGPIRILVEYELAKIRNLRVDNGGRPDVARIRFDYGTGSSALGGAMPRVEAERQVATIQSAIRALGRPPIVNYEFAADDPVVPFRLGEPVEVPPPPGLGSTASVVALVVANLVPVFGVLGLGWDLGDIMVLFWAENAVIGFYNVLKLVAVARWGAVAVVPFFVGHFGGFMAVHFLFVYSFFVRGISTPGADAPFGTALPALFVPLLPALASLFVSHGVSFVGNFLKGREYVDRKMAAQMAEPYQRVVILHLTIIFGGWAIMLLGQPIVSLVVLLALKTMMDLRAHLRQHGRGRRSVSNSFEPATEPLSRISRRYVPTGRPPGLESRR